MIELPDDELDKLFRKSSEEFDPTYEPEDWSALKKRLDREDGKSPAGWLRKWWPAGILVLLLPAGLAGYYFMNETDSEKKRDKQISVQERKNAPVLSESGNSASVRDLKKEKRKSHVLAKNDLRESNEDKNLKNGKQLHQSENQLRKDESGNTIGKNSKSETEGFNRNGSKELSADKIADAKILPRSRSKAGGVFLEPDRSKGKEGDGAFSSDKNISSVSGNPVSRVKTFENELHRNKVSGGANNFVGDRSGITDNSENVLKVNSEINEAESRLLFPLNFLTHSPFNQKSPLTLPAIASPESPEPAVSPQSEQRDLSPKFAVRIGYSPDLSSVGLDNFSKPGSAFSFLAEYALVPKLYVQAGITRSEKVYFAKANEYEWPAEWKMGPKAISTDATCKIIEIPLNLRFDLIQNSQSRLFAGAGVSSYHMQNERYVYNYLPNTHYIKWYDYQTKTGWYFLSHINASAGYERRITNKLSILAEPYVRIPVKKVGYGKVNLFTAGMWISLRYTPVFFK